MFVAAVVFLAAATPPPRSSSRARTIACSSPPQPTQTGNKIEVLEFFSYACPHCNSLQPSLHAWLKRKPADVEFRRVPAVFQEPWLPFARLYYTLEAMGLVDKLHHEVFTAIHEQKVQLQDPKVLFDWVASKGVDQQEIHGHATTLSPCSSRTQALVDTTRAATMSTFTPALVVDGRYLTGLHDDESDRTRRLRSLLQGRRSTDRAGAQETRSAK